MDLAALRVDAGHHMLDGAVLTGCVHRLEDSEQGPAILCVQPFLQIRKPLDTFGQQVFGLLLVDVEASGVASITVCQSKFLSLVDAIAIDKLRQLHLLHPEPALFASEGSIAAAARDC